MDILEVLYLVLSIAVGLLLLVLLVVVHELGHAIVARRNGVVVEEFGIGFPPRAWSRTLKNGVLFSLNWLPLGGFVKLQGENDDASQPGDYGAASYWVKTKILLAGVVINWLTAAALLTVLAVVGMPKLLPDQFQMPGDTREVVSPVELATIGENSPAQKAGLRVKDQIVQVGDEPVETVEDLQALSAENKGKTVPVIYDREGRRQTTDVVFNSDDTNGYLGVGLVPSSVTLRSTWSAPIVGVVTAAQLTSATVVSLGQTVAHFAAGIGAVLNPDASVRTAGTEQLNQLSSNVAGPIGILGVLFPSAVEAGIVPLLTVTAIISLTLAVMNILPIPALDGGRFFLMTVFRLLRKPLTKEREEKINTIGFVALMLLVLLVTVSDVGKLF